ncbi:exported hypothetical protein [Mesorhizobium sp. ORS 3359]|nr:exported hypothetical protein [Mesorhizobium sp. ORS 3359]
MSNSLAVLRTIAPIIATSAMVAVVALAPHSGMFAFWLTLPMNATGWRYFGANDQSRR